MDAMVQTLSQDELSTRPHLKIFPSLPIDGPRHGKSLRICFVNWEFPGPVYCGGANISLAMMGEELAKRGHKVTFLYTQPDVCTRHNLKHWIKDYKSRGIRFVPLPPVNGVDIRHLPRWIRVSYEVYDFLKNNKFDVFHSVDFSAEGYFTCIAKHLGLAFHNMLIVTGTHGPTLWGCQINYDRMCHISVLASDFMEQRILATSDVLISPSQYMLNWNIAHGRKLPARTYMQQNITLRPIEGPGGGRRVNKVKEIVYFGRLEPRKGYELFCEAVSLLPRSVLKNLTITFLGKSLMMHIGDTRIPVKKAASQWPCKWQIFEDKRNDEALKYLASHPCVAVIPSRGENSPCVVLECIGAGIPFLASEVGGIPELIAEKDRARVCFRPQAEILAERLMDVIKNGHASAKPAVDFEENNQRWIEWHERLALPKAPQLNVIMPFERMPLVSVCLYSRNKVAGLRRAVASLRKQDYLNFEVILVDDGSTDPSVKAALREMEPQFVRRRWKIIREGHVGKAAATNAALRHARGDYIKTMSDSDIAASHQLSTGVRVMKHSNADIVTSLFDLPSSNKPGKGNKYTRFLFVGPSVTVGALQNCYGSYNAMMRRDVLEELGGYSEARGLFSIHWELYSRAALEGYHLELVPEALYRNDGSDFWQFTTPDNLDNLQQMKPYLDKMQPEFRALAVFASGHARPWPRPAPEEPARKKKARKKPKKVGKAKKASTKTVRRKLGRAQKALRARK